MYLLYINVYTGVYKWCVYMYVCIVCVHILCMLMYKYMYIYGIYIYGTCVCVCVRQLRGGQEQLGGGELEDER